MLATRALACSLIALCGVASAMAQAPASPGTAGDTSSVTPPTPRAAHRLRRLVYTCHDAGVIVFADRPCGPATQPLHVDLHVPEFAGRAPALAPPAAVPARPHAADDTAAAPDPAATRCAKLREAVAALDDRMRAGYSAHEAPRLWERWREARERLHSAKC